MRRKAPKVSIGIPVFNGEAYLPQALSSLQEQSFQDFEILISDNASTDSTPDIVHAFARRDARIVSYRQARNVGAAANYNQVFAMAEGQYFRWHAHDDLVAPTYLERCVRVMERDPSVVVCHTRTLLVGPDAEPLAPDPAGHGFLDGAGGHLPPPDAMGRAVAADPALRFADFLHHTRWCFEIFGLMDHQVLRRSLLHGPYYGSDKVLLAQLSLLGRFHEIDETLFLRRCHPRQSTSQDYWGRAAFIDPSSAKRHSLAQLSMLRDYLRAIHDAPLHSGQRLRCHLALLRQAARPAKWRRLLVPGPDNYLGLDWPRPASARRADATPAD